jgi:hypothetical protein
LIQIPAFPVARPSQRVTFTEPPRHRHEQGPGKVRGRLVEHSRRVGCNNSALGARRHVNVVKTNRYVRRNLQFRRRLQQFVVHFLRQQADHPFFIPYAS